MSKVREEFPEAINPFTTQKYVRCPIFYISSLPLDITHKPTKERTHSEPGGRNWAPKKRLQK